MIMATTIIATEDKKQQTPSSSSASDFHQQRKKNFNNDDQQSPITTHSTTADGSQDDDDVCGKTTSVSSSTTTTTNADEEVEFSFIKTTLPDNDDDDDDDDRNTEDDDTEKKVVKDDDWKEEERHLFHRQGRYFSVLLLLVAAISLMNGVGQFVAYIITNDWSRNFVSTYLGYASAKEAESDQAGLGLDIHALIGVAILIPIVLQAWNAYYLHHDRSSSKTIDKSSSRIVSLPFHQFNGWMIVVVWVFMGITGLVFSFVSQKYDEIFDGKLWSWQRVVQMTVNLWSTFAFMIMNLFCGIRAVMSIRRGSNMKDQQSRQHVMLHHKGMMFFAIFWPLRSGLDQCLLAAHQFLLRDRFMGEGEYFVYMTAVVCTIWLIVLYGFAWFCEPNLLSYKFMKLNLIGLSFKTFGNWAIAVYVSHSAYFSS